MKTKLFALILTCTALLALTACMEKAAVEAGPDRYGGIRYIPAFQTLDTKGDEFRSGCVVGNYLYLTGSTITNEAYQDRTVRLIRVPLEGGEIEELPGCLPPSGDRNVIASTEGTAIAAGEDGTLWLLEDVGRWYYNFPEDFDPYDMSGGTRGEYYIRSERFYVLRQLDQEGGELFRQEWPQGELEERLGLTRNDFISSAFVSAGGDVTFWVRSNNDLLVTVDKTGALLGKVEREDQDQSWQGAVRLGDGRLAVWGSRMGNGVFTTGLCAISPKGDALEESWTLPGFSTVYGGDANTLFYYNNGNDLMAWKEPPAEDGGEAAEDTPLLSWINTGLDNSGTRLVTEFLPDGRLAVLTGGGRFNTDETVELAVLTPTSDPPEKTVLTLGTLELLGQTERAVRMFNRTNQDYQIEVREYMDFSDYNTADSRREAIERLSVEVGAGRVPDILDTYGMPLAGWASSGILEDLWPWIDLDRDIEREDLMVRVLEADSINGKLYELPFGFSFATAVGLKEAVGGRTAWTLEDMNAALAGMPEGCISFPSDRYGMLGAVLQTFWSRLVDVETGKCSFDSGEFRQMLEFCGQLPEEDVPYDEESAMAGSKELMLLFRYPGSFWEMQEFRSEFRGPVSYVGIPNPWGAAGSGFVAGSTLAMSSGGQHKEGVWAFLRTMLLPYDQPVGFGRRFPINKGAFDRMFQQDAQGQESSRHRYAYTDSNGRTQYYKAATQADYDQIMELYEAVDSMYRWDSGLGEMILEIAGAYFAGDKTLDETVQLIQNRAQLYVDEQN